MKIKITKNKIFAAAAILSTLTAAWFCSGNFTEKSTAAGQAAAYETTAAVSAVPSVSADITDMEEAAACPEEESVIADAPSAEAPENETPQAGPATSSETADSKAAEPAADSVGNQNLTNPAPAGEPEPAEPQDAGTADTASTCTLSVACKTILDNTDSFNEDKLEVLPGDGIIFSAARVTFYEGESVFNVLRRQMKKAGIQMEFEATPIYNSNYIEGIANIYEFDCGELSGWMYKVNGAFPNYGCSRYQVKDGDVIELVYTCDLGRDVGGDYAANTDGAA